MTQKTMTARILSKKVSIASLTMLALISSGCGSANFGESNDGSRNSAVTRTVTHVFGDTQIEGAPERVASVGFREHDALLALGVKPVMVHQWYSEYSSGVAPWAEPYLEGDKPTVIPATAEGLPFEEIAAEEPDLIVGLDAGLDEKTYNRLTEVAPTIANPAGAAPYAVPYAEETRMIGEAVGKADEADQLVKDTDQAFADAQKAHPEFEDKTAAVGCPLDNGGFALYPTTDPRGEFLTKLGLTAPKEIDETAKGDYYAEISAENLSMMNDYDLLLIIDDCGNPTADLDEHPTFKSLDVAQRGDYVYPAPAADALSHNTVLSVPYALDKLIPEIEKVLS